MDTIYILGANGFVGRHLARFYQNNTNANVIPLTKQDLNITNREHYGRYDFRNALIIDCIARINGSPEEIVANNVNGLEQFLEYLTQKEIRYRYLYLSTISTLDKHLVANHTYVASKFRAENLVRKYCPDYKIVRLSYPFGPGEAPNRLISRLIHKALRSEEITIADISLQLTPVDGLVRVLPDVIGHPDKEINVAAKEHYPLKEIINYIYSKINKHPRFKLQKTVTVPVLPGVFYPVPTVKTVFETIDQLIEGIITHY